jgi:hypothetical protein
VTSDLGAVESKNTCRLLITNRRHRPLSMRHSFVLVCHRLGAAFQFMSTVSVKSCTAPEAGVNAKMRPSAATSYGYGCTPAASASRITTEGVPSSTEDPDRPNRAKDASRLFRSEADSTNADDAARCTIELQLNSNELLKIETRAVA